MSTLRKPRKSLDRMRARIWRWHYTRAFNAMTGFDWTPRELASAGAYSRQWITQWQRQDRRAANRTKSSKDSLNRVDVKGH